MHRLLEDFRYQAVFIFPPWEEIYCTDDERDHTFEHSVNVHESILQFYLRHEYNPIEVPRDTIENRVQFILAHL